MADNFKYEESNKLVVFTAKLIEGHGKSKGCKDELPVNKDIISALQDLAAETRYDSDDEVSEEFTILAAKLIKKNEEV